MKSWDAERLARAAGAQLAGGSAAAGPERAELDSRKAGPGALFVGLRGASTDGGRFAGEALGAGAWGALVSPEHVEQARAAAAGVVLAAEDPLAALQTLATVWRRELGAQVIGVTGSTGKTSTKDLLLTVLAPHRRTVASRANFNTEIGLPLEILAAPLGTEVLVLEMAMRGAGQIAELAAIAEPDVGVIVNVGPVHLELLGTIEAVAAAKAELLDGLAQGATAVLPASEPLLEPHIPDGLRVLTFGDGGDVTIVSEHGEQLVIDSRGRQIKLEVGFEQRHQRRNLLAAVAAADAIGVTAAGRIDLATAQGRGQRLALSGGVTVIDDCYNANPMSMLAALEDLARTAERSHRRVAVLGDMLELGPDEREFHLALGEQARSAGVDVLVTVGPRAQAIAERFGGRVRSVADAAEAANLVPGLLEPGDVVLVKGSRGVGLELVCRAISNGSSR